MKILRHASLWLATFFLCLFVFPAVVFAHPWHPVTSFQGGFFHPFTGLDHMVAMFAVGLWAVQLGGRAVWLLPLSFVSLMLGGGALNEWSVGLSGVEQIIAASSLLIGLMIAWNARLPLWIGTAFVGFFAIFHGYAHVAEMGSHGLSDYATGFVLATGLLHAMGIFAGRLAKQWNPRVLRFAGAAMAFLSIFMIF